MSYMTLMDQLADNTKARSRLHKYMEETGQGLYVYKDGDEWEASCWRFVGRGRTPNYAMVNLAMTMEVERVPYCFGGTGGSVPTGAG